MNVSSSNATAVQPSQRLAQIHKTDQKAEVQERQQAAEMKKSADAQAMPVINTRGQTTGRLLNVTA